MAARHSASMDGSPNAGPQTWSCSTMILSVATVFFPPARRDAGCNVGAECPCRVDRSMVGSINQLQPSRLHVAIRGSQKPDNQRRLGKFSRTPLTKHQIEIGGAFLQAVPPQPPIPAAPHRPTRQSHHFSLQSSIAPVESLVSTSLQSSPNPYSILPTHPFTTHLFQSPEMLRCK
jgi:hypothetical protein